MEKDKNYDSHPEIGCFISGLFIEGKHNKNSIKIVIVNMIIIF